MKYTTFNPRPYEIHHLALGKIKPGSCVLELGCATGYITQILKQRNCFVTAIDFEKESLLSTKKIADETIEADLNKPQSIHLKKKYDVVLLMDVIEHLLNRKELLQHILSWLQPDGILILSTPNIAHIRVRANLLRGKFTYTDVGIMDTTHVHFYTKETLTQEISDAGFNIHECIGSADFGQIPFIGRVLRHIPKRIQFTIVSLCPQLLAVQWLVVAQKKK